MKLRTRITVLCTAVFVIAVLICDIAIWSICKKSLLDGALNSAYADSYAVSIKFAQYIDSLSGNPNKTAVEYFFKSTKDDYTVCASVREKEEYYNNTVFSVQELDAKEKKKYPGSVSFSYSMFRWEGRSVICFYDSSLLPGMQLYHLTDISNTYDQINTLFLQMLAVSAAVCAGVAVLLYVIIRRSLLPLGTLSEKARSMADGHYEERLQIGKNDEIGQLAQDFNKMADAVEQHTRQIEASEEKKTLFMGSLTHELKTPLTVISGYAETMLRVRLSEEDTVDALYYIKNECGRLSRLSGKMMRLLELEQGDALSLRIVPVGALFDAVKKSCTGKAEAAGVSIESSDLGESINCDLDLMTDVLINLTDNAIKASSPGSLIRLYTETAENGFFIVVQDRGCGIPKNEMERVFEPFYMVDKSRARKNGGAGLGLSLTAQILKRHGFPITVCSQMGEGTQMRIYISMNFR